MTKEERTRNLKCFVYVAEDGTEFSSEFECKSYEETVQCVIKKKYNQLVIGKTSETVLFGGNDHNIDILRLGKSYDVDTVLQVVKHFRGSIDDNTANSVRNAFENKDYLLMGWSYDNDCCWTYGTVSEAKKRYEQGIKDAIKLQKDNESK